VVNPVVTAKARMINFVRLAAIQARGGKECSGLFCLARSKTAISAEARI
jgi:hypothetical protein